MAKHQARTYSLKIYHRYFGQIVPGDQCSLCKNLSALGKDNEAMTMMEDMIKKGRAMPGIK